MRIVSLCPSLTELVLDLGRGVDLVGVTTYCVHPARDVAALEKVFQGVTTLREINKTTFVD